MKIEFMLPSRPADAGRTEMVSPRNTVGRRPPRITCLLALAHRFEELVRTGEVKDYADLARLGHVSRARVSQILKLLTLAPSIQDLIVDLPTRAHGDKVITERHLRRVVREPRWDRQRILFDRICRVIRDQGR